MRVLSAAIAMLIGKASAATDYVDNGASWTDGAVKNEVCKTGKMQGPIDLDTTMTADKEESNYFHYENVIGDKEGKYVYGTEKEQGTVYWSDKSSAVYVQLDNTVLAPKSKDANGEQLPTDIPTKARKFHTAPNWFESSEAAKYDGATDGKYWAKQLHFHWESEHKIDGEYKDFEMHIVHQGKDSPDADDGDFPLGKLGVMGVMFDTKKYDKGVSNATIAAIDKFFDNLMYEKIDSGKTIIADEIALGELMAALNLNDRFIYHGSLTTPPCYENLFFNVLSTVYPMKQYHLDYYKKVIQARAVDGSNVKTTGNHRLSRTPTPENKLKLVKGEPVKIVEGTEVSSAAANASLALTIIFVVVMLVAMALTIYNCVLWEEIKKADNPPENNVEIGPGGVAADASEKKGLSA